MRALVTGIVGTLIALGPIDVWADQRAVAPATEAAALRAMVAAIPIGARVSLQTVSGRRLKGTLMRVDDAGMVVKRGSRVPEPALGIRFDEIARLERDDGHGGVNLAKALAIGLAAGAGAILSFFAIALSVSD